MPDLAVLVPSRGRPESVKRLTVAFEETCRADTTLIFGFDADDDSVPKAAWKWATQSFRPWAFVAPDLRQVVAWINYLANSFKDEFRFLGTIGDDNVPRTVGWDERVIESLQRQGTGFCYGDDRYPHRPRGALATHVFMTSDVVRELGYMGPPCLRHMCVDDVWTAWGKETSIEFLGDVVIEHLHHSAGHAEVDAVYRDSEQWALADMHAFGAYVASGDFARDVEKIKRCQRCSRESA